MVIYKENGCVYVGEFLPTSKLPKNCIITNTVPPEPIESWYIEDGQIKVDQEKLTQFKRQQMTPLTKRQFNLVMYDKGLLKQVKELLAQNERNQIEFDSTDTITRFHPTVIQLSQDLGLTEEEVDALWLEALSIS